MILAALLLAAQTSIASPLETKSTADVWSKVGPEIRSRIHLRSSGLPPYPEDGVALADVKRWPLSRTFDGVLCEAEFTELLGHGFRLRLKSLSEISEGSGYAIHYVPPGGAWEPRGPAYFWNADGTVKERSYSSATRRETWLYLPPGKVHHYSVVERDSSGDQGYVDEWFAPDGALLGCTVAIASQQIDRSFWKRSFWMGQEVPTDEMYRRVADYFGWKRPEE
jgi:hypothetical protein